MLSFRLRPPAHPTRRAWAVASPRTCRFSGVSMRPPVSSANQPGGEGLPYVAGTYSRADEVLLALPNRGTAGTRGGEPARARSSGDLGGVLAYAAAFAGTSAT